MALHIFLLGISIQSIDIFSWRIEKTSENFNNTCVFLRSLPLPHKNKIHIFFFLGKQEHTAFSYTFPNSGLPNLKHFYFSDCSLL